MKSLYTINRLAKSVRDTEDLGFVERSEEFARKMLSYRASHWDSKNFASQLVSDLNEREKFYYRIVRDFQENSEIRNRDIVAEIRDYVSRRTIHRIQLILYLQQITTGDTQHQKFVRSLEAVLRLSKLKKIKLIGDDSDEVDDLQNQLGNAISLLITKTRNNEFDLDEFLSLYEEAMVLPHQNTINALLEVIIELYSWGRYKNYDIDVRLFNEIAIHLLEELSNFSDVDVSILSNAFKVSSKVLYDFDKDNLKDLTESFFKKIEKATEDEIIEVINGLTRLETEDNSLKLIMDYLMHKLSSLKEKSLVFMLYANCVFDFSTGSTSQVLEELKNRGWLEPRSIAKSYHAAVLFNYDVPYWQELFNRVCNDDSPRVTDEKNSKGERQTSALLKKYFIHRGCDFDLKTSWYKFGFEFDNLVELEEGVIIDVEFDGIYFHNRRELKDYFRDAVLIKLGVDVVRFNGKVLDEILELDQEEQFEALDEVFAFINE